MEYGEAQLENDATDAVLRRDSVPHFHALMLQTQSFDETLSLTSTPCKSPTITSISSLSSSLGCRLRINVCGLHFETFVSLFDRHPSTLLGDPQRRLRFYDASRDELFLDRHRPTFEAVFAYYQTGGRLRRPLNVPHDVFYSELEFYQLEPGFTYYTASHKNVPLLFYDNFGKYEPILLILSRL